MNYEARDFRPLFAALLLGVGLFAAIAVAAVVSAAPTTATIIPLGVAFVLAVLAMRVYTKHAGLRRMPSNPQVALPFILFLLLVPVIAFAQTDTLVTVQLPDVTTTEGLILYLMPGVTAFLLYLLKNALYDKVVQSDGTIKWEVKFIPKEVLPWLGPVIGLLIGALTNYFGGLELNVLTAAFASSLSTLLFELAKPITRTVGRATRQ